MALRDWLAATATLATPATVGGQLERSVATVAAVAVATPANERLADPDVERRRARALALLAAKPELRIAVIAEPGDPIIVGVAIRGLTYGELEIPADRYDVAALMALMDRHAGATIH